MLTLVSNDQLVSAEDAHHDRDVLGHVLLASDNVCEERPEQHAHETAYDAVQRRGCTVRRFDSSFLLTAWRAVL